MDDAFMTIGSIAIVLCAVWFLTKPFWGEKIKHAFISKKSPAAVAKIILKKDLSSKCAGCTFYMNNDYDNEYSQSEWTELFKEQVLAKELDADSEEYAKAVAPFINAIAVSNTGFYMRRGLEDLDRQLERFMPGVNDRISLNYFLEPYEYNKDEEREAQSKSEEKLRQKEWEEEAPQRAAFERCRKCVHYHKCSITVRQQTGSCGGYTPK